MLTNEERVSKANDLRAKIDATKPVVEWGMRTSVWTNVASQGVRVYVNDKRGAVAILVIEKDGSITPQWQSGHSMTRNELRTALGVK